MERNTPNEWTESFVRSNRQFCIDRLIDMNRTAIDLVKVGDAEHYAGAVYGLRQMLVGLETMLHVDNGDMKRLISALIADNAFHLGLVLLACTDYSEQERRSVAVDSFRIAIQYSQTSTAKYAEEMIEMLQSNMSLSKVLDAAFSDFPEELVILMEDALGGLKLLS